MAASSELVAGIVSQIIEIPIPIHSVDDIVKLYEDALANNPRIKIAIIGVLTVKSWSFGSGVDNFFRTAARFEPD